MSAGFEVIVEQVHAVAEGIREFVLVRADGSEFPLYSAGCHVVLRLPLPGRDHRNPYSLLGDPARRDRWRIAVHRQPQSRGGSAWLHERAVRGTRLTISTPVNLFPLLRTARHHVLVAGGIGITPILAQARELQRLGASYEVHYGYRSLGRAAYVGELDDAAPGRVSRYDAAWRQQPAFDQLLAARPLGTHLYLCGPTAMIDAALAAAADLGWPASHLHVEQFIAPSGGQPFVVELRRSGKRFIVPSDLSLLEAIEQQGVDAPSLCRGGACGQCETEVVEADAAFDHRDHFLSAEEHAAGRKIMPCVSRLKGGCLVLDA